MRRRDGHDGPGDSQQPDPNVRWIESDRALVELCDAAGAAGRFAIDTEFIRDKTYFPILALVQINVAGDIAIIDPLSGLDLSPLDDLVCDPSVQKVLHAAQQDLEIFFLRTGQGPANIFDTQLAAAMGGLGRQAGLGALTDSFLDISLDKGPQYTDWLRRPLSARQEHYAAEDVRHLLVLQDRLLDSLAELNRLDALEEELERLINPKLYAVDIDQIMGRVKGSGSAKAQERAVLRRVVKWREDDAAHVDRPRRWVLADDALMAVVRAKPQSMRELSRVRGVSDRLLHRVGDRLLAAVAQGLDDPAPTRAPSPPKRQNGSKTVPAAFLGALLKSLCEEANISPVMVGTSSDLDALVDAWQQDDLAREDLVLLTGWRGQLVGRPLLDFLQGKSAVYLDPKTHTPVLFPRS